MNTILTSRKAQYDAACASLEAVARRIEHAPEGADLKALEAQLNDAVAKAERAQENLEVARRASQFSDSQNRRGATVTDPFVYSRENYNVSFFRDLFMRDFAGDMAARDRLERHYRQIADITPAERRDIGTGAFTGLVVPQYLVDLYAPYLRAGRPFANRVRKLPLPAEGMVFNISRLTTGTTAESQATEGTSVSNTDAHDSTLTINVHTIAGEQNVSRQLLERGTPGMDELIFQDLLSSYSAKIDNQVLNGTGLNGTHLGLLNTAGIMSSTYTDASPSVSEIYPKVSDVLQQIASNRFMPADLIAMHPRRWGWFTAALDANGRPLVVPVAQPLPNVANNAAAVQGQPAYGDVVGYLQGVPVITDANIPTNVGAGANQDLIIACRTADIILWEEADGVPRQARFEQTLAEKLEVKLVIYGYSAYTAGRYPQAIGTISGTGLVAPTF